jgi:hypothetical protein
MIRTTHERELVARKARRWRDTLRTARIVTLSAGERAELAHVLDELQHFAVHGPIPTSPGGA